MFRDCFPTSSNPIFMLMSSFVSEESAIVSLQLEISDSYTLWKSSSNNQFEIIIIYYQFVNLESFFFTFLLSICFL